LQATHVAGGCTPLALSAAALTHFSTSALLLLLLLPLLMQPLV
jgi:hypothetical protein